MRSTLTVVVLIALVVAILPVFFYACNFGFVVSGDHSRWAQAGDFFGGVYATLTSLLTLLLLVSQAVYQHRFNMAIQDESRALALRAEISRVLDTLEAALRATCGQGHLGDVRNFLCAAFEKRSLDWLKGGQARHEFSAFYQNADDRLTGLWALVYSKLSNENSEPVTNERWQKVQQEVVLEISSRLGYGTCVALDNLHFVAANQHGALLPYRFSSVLLAPESFAR